MFSSKPEVSLVFESATESAIAARSIVLDAVVAGFASSGGCGGGVGVISGLKCCFSLEAGVWLASESGRDTTPEAATATSCS